MKYKFLALFVALAAAAGALGVGTAHATATCSGTVLVPQWTATDGSVGPGTITPTIAGVSCSSGVITATLCSDYTQPATGYVIGGGGSTSPTWTQATCGTTYGGTSTTYTGPGIGCGSLPDAEQGAVWRTRATVYSSDGGSVSYTSAQNDLTYAVSCGAPVNDRCIQNPINFDTHCSSYVPGPSPFIEYGGGEASGQKDVSCTEVDAGATFVPGIFTAGQIVVDPATTTCSSTEGTDYTVRITASLWRSADGCGFTWPCGGLVGTQSAVGSAAGEGEKEFELPGWSYKCSPTRQRYHFFLIVDLKMDSNIGGDAKEGTHYNESILCS